MGVEPSSAMSAENPREALCRAARDFWRGRGASVAIESALGASILVLALGALAAIALDCFVADRMGRAARAAARAVALAPDAVAQGISADTIACAAIRHELDLRTDFDCAASWTLTIDAGLRPSELPGETNSGSVAGDGHMVLVRLDWNRQPWSFGSLLADANGAGAAEVAVGLARSEPSAEI